MVHYRYPDQEDKILLSFAAQSGPYGDYWLDSESGALSKLDEFLSAELPAREEVHALDAGCGRGRALPWIASHASSICAIDPDEERLADAREVRLGSLQERTKIDFRNLAIDALPDHLYDLIVCNHVIQHVPTAVSKAMLAKFRKLASPSCVLVMSFSRSAVNNESFGISHLSEGVPSLEQIDQATFDFLAADGGDRGLLPVRMIDPDAFAVQAEAGGWDIIWNWTYHAAAWADFGQGIRIDDEINQSTSLNQNCQGDIYLAMRIATRGGK